MRNLILTAAVAALSTVAVAPQEVLASDFPERRIQISFPWAAGSPAYVLSQIIADGMTEELGVDIAVVSRPGAGGVNSFMAGLAEPADGYTIIDGWVAPLMISPMFDKAEYEYDDVIPLHSAGAVALAVVSRADEDRWTDFPSFVEYLRENPGETRFTGSEELTLPHLVATSMLMDQGLVSRNVPYVGLAPGVKDLRGGLLDWMLVNAGSYKANKDHLRVLAVLSDNAEAAGVYDGAPMIGEFGVDLGLSGLAPMSWNWWVVKADTPDDVVARLRSAMEASLEDPDVQQKIRDLGFLPSGYSADEYAEVAGQIDAELRSAMEAVQWLRDELKALQ